MKALKKSLAVSAIVLAAPLASHAVEVSGNVTVATDYVFRGFSQTDEKAAIQGGLDLEFDSGFYVGTWASNVNFGPDSNASTEFDYYVGWGGDLTDDVSFDVNFTYFVYQGDSSANYPEYGASLSWMDLTFGFIYSNEYFGDDGPNFYYPYLGYDMALPEDFGLSFHVGYNRTNEDDFFADGKKKYYDWSVGLTKEVMGVELGLTYYDTNISGVDEADARVVFSISKSL